MGGEKLSAHAARLSSESDAVFDALARESDRALVLVGAEWLSDCLEFVLRVEFSTHGIPFKEQKELLKGVTAPFSTLWARTTACRAFGVLPHEICDLLDLYRKVRNRCAHGKAVVSLDDTEVRNQVRKFREFLKRIGKTPESKASPREVMSTVSRTLGSALTTISFTMAQHLKELMRTNTQLGEILLLGHPKNPQSRRAPRSANRPSDSPPPKPAKKSPTKRRGGQGRSGRGKPKSDA